MAVWYADIANIDLDSSGMVHRVDKVEGDLAPDAGMAGAKVADVMHRDTQLLVRTEHGNGERPRPVRHEQRQLVQSMNSIVPVVWISIA